MLIPDIADYEKESEWIAKGEKQMIPKSYSRSDARRLFTAK